jgi:hypothetical protein
MPRLARRVVLVAVLSALAGCASAPLPTPIGSMWGFFTDAEPNLGPRALVYTSSRVACESERRRRVDVVSPVCVPLTVTAGTGYYAIALPFQLTLNLPDGAVGTLERERCEKLRTDLFLSYSAMGDCVPVEVRQTR